MARAVMILGAAIVGGLLGFVLGGLELQHRLTGYVYNSHDRIGPAEGFSITLCALLGSVTACAFVLRHNLRIAGWICLGGSLGCLAWLAFGDPRDSRATLHGLLFVLFGGQYRDFSLWNTSRSTAHEAIAKALIYHGVPLLWSGILLWSGCKLLLHFYRGDQKHHTSKVAPELLNSAT